MLDRIMIAVATSLVCMLAFASTASAQCPDGQATCSGECVNLQEDDDNCGGCGKTCERYEACVRGSCKLMCPDVQLVCGDVCVTAASDPSHCGGCNNKCGTDEYCSGGSCQKVCKDPLKAKTGSSTTKKKK